MTKLFSAAAGITMLAGILLYIHNVAVIGSDWAKSGTGIVFAIGGIIGIAGGIVGGSMLGPIGKKMGELGKEIEAKGGVPSPDQIQQMNALNARLAQISRLDLLLVLGALILMEVARYIPS